MTKETFYTADKSADFVVVTDDFGALEIRSHGDKGFHYFYDTKRRRLIKHFVLRGGPSVTTVCDLTLIKKRDSFSPRLRLWKRDNKLLKVAEADVQVSSPEVRHMRASVNTDDCYLQFWRLIDFVRTFSSIELPDNDFRVAAGVDASLLGAIRDGKVSASEMTELAEAIADSEEARRAFVETSSSDAIAHLIRHRRQEEVISRLKGLVQDAGTTEPEVQRVLRGQSWLFGGRFVGEAKRRRLTILNEVDIPLIRSDGTIHVVELKTPVVPDLVREHRNDLIVGDMVNEAVGQLANYLKALDEQRHTILNELGIECRRSFGTVVLGHSEQTAYSAKKISEVLRTYGSHLARIDIMTYEELIDGAERALNLPAGQIGDPPVEQG